MQTEDLPQLPESGVGGDNTGSSEGWKKLLASLGMLGGAGGQQAGMQVSSPNSGFGVLKTPTFQMPKDDPMGKLGNIAKIVGTVAAL